MKISVITVCLNHPLLDRTIESVLNQTYKNIDYWVIDGKSNRKETLQTIERYRDIDHVNIVSEKDNGIYDAMNKGIHFSTGEYLIFLNAGDTFYNNKSLEILSSSCTGQDIIYGDLEVKSEMPFIKRYPDKLSFGYFAQGETLPHPGTLIKRDVFNKCGSYSTEMIIVSDWAFFLKATCQQNNSYKHVPEIIATFEIDGISSNPLNQELISEEKHAFLTNNFPAFYDEYLELMCIKQKHQHLKNSRLRKYLSYFFKQLEI